MMKIILALLTLFVLHAAARAADKITIGVPELNAQFVPLALAEKKGFFREAGIQADVIRINPTVALAALVSGELDYWTVIGNSVAAAIQGVPLRVLACYVPGSPSALIARPEFKAVQDLRGKAVGLNTSGGALESIARLIFKHFGVDPDKDIKFLALGTNERRFSSMKQGLTAATNGFSAIGLYRQEDGVCGACAGPRAFQLSYQRHRGQPEENQRKARGGQARDQGGHQGQPLYQAGS